MSNELWRLSFVVFLVTQAFHALLVAPVLMDWLIMFAGFTGALYISYELIHAYKEAK